MKNIALLGFVLAGVAACGGKVTPDGPLDQPLSPETRTSVSQALSRCEGSLLDMTSTFDRGMKGTATTTAALLEGKWLRCPEHQAQFHESFGVEVLPGEICTLETDGAGKLVSHVAPSCVPWKVVTAPFEGVQFGGVITGADFSADAKLFRACANPYCAVYVRVD